MSGANFSTGIAGGTCRQHHPRFNQRRARPAKRGALAITSPDVARRLMDEGVPAAEVHAVAMQLRRILPLLSYGDDAADVRLLPWTEEMLNRYGDKIASLFMSIRGRVER